MAFEELKKVATGKVNTATLREIEKNCRANELPEFILCDGMAGTLVAFADRCMVIKKGFGTSLMTSSLGGGRTATFLYTDITGIEFNSGLVMGTLEILTASYTGKKTNSVWTFGSDNSAYEMSNVLPWSNVFFKQVRDQVEWLKNKVHSAKSLPTAITATSTADELSKLANLHKSGVLSDAEFIVAKAKLLDRL